RSTAGETDVGGHGASRQGAGGLHGAGAAQTAEDARERPRVRRHRAGSDSPAVTAHRPTHQGTVVAEGPAELSAAASPGSCSQHTYTATTSKKARAWHLTTTGGLVHCRNRQFIVNDPGGHVNAPVDPVLVGAERQRQTRARQLLHVPVDLVTVGVQPRY